MKKIVDKEYEVYVMYANGGLPKEYSPKTMMERFEKVQELSVTQAMAAAKN
jgi:hypothetical protein